MNADQQFGRESESEEKAYWLGVRDARLGHAEWAPVRPYSKAELAAYRAGYADQRITMATKA